jgi:DNA-binding phage protein
MQSPTYLPAVRDSSADVVRRLAPSLHAAIPDGDALLDLPGHVVATLAAVYGIANADALLQLPDRDILAIVKASCGNGERRLAEVAAWLYRMRIARGELVSTALEAKALVEQALNGIREQIGEAVRSAVLAQGLRAQEVARRCGSSREAVASLLNGDSTPSFELGLRMAISLGMRIKVQVV